MYGVDMNNTYIQRERERWGDGRVARGRNNDEDNCCCRVSVAEMSDRVRRVDGKEGPTSSHGKQKCTSPNKQRRKKKKR